MEGSMTELNQSECFRNPNAESGEIIVNRNIQGFLGAALFVACSAVGAAPITYDYTGQSYSQVHVNNGSPPVLFSMSERITGSITLSADLGANLSNAPITPLSFTFSDGIHSISGANADTADFRFSTDPLGHITDWFVLVRTAFAANTVFDEAFSQGRFGDFAENGLCGPGSSPPGCTFDGSAYDQIASNPNAGSFVLQTVAVPEPATLPLALMAVAGAVVARKCVRRRQAPAA